MRYAGLLFAIIAFSTNAAEMQYQFNSPSFNGVGYSTHILTLNQLENQAVDKNKAATDALIAKAQSEAQNTPQSRFLANLESRIYSQLAKQLTDSMFSEGSNCITPGVICGSMPDLGGNTVTWGLGSGSDQGMIIINITNNNDPSQNTLMKVPSGTFAF
jgi:hypothetical protein